MMTKWEYLVEEIESDFHPVYGQVRVLNKFGKKGWELVGLLSIEQGNFAYFKREIKTPNNFAVTIKEGI